MFKSTPISTLPIVGSVDGKKHDVTNYVFVLDNQRNKILLSYRKSTVFSVNVLSTWSYDSMIDIYISVYLSPLTLWLRFLCDGDVHYVIMFTVDLQQDDSFNL